MAGTIFGLPLSQRVDGNGKPLVGWLLYLYNQNSSTPVNSYQDTGLTVLNTWPLVADASGMMGVFWLADGSYRVRGTSNDGSLTLFDMQSVQALGPSTGSAPSGGVDPNAIFQTGDVIWLDFQGTRTGWVRDNGKTIGSATSGATERANADCQALFTFLWNNFADTICPVVGGRGANANADWTANKKLTTPDKRGYVVGGLDDMGNSAAARWASVPVIGGSVTTPGATLGEALHTVTQSELPNVNFTNSGITLNDHTHARRMITQNAALGAGGIAVWIDNGVTSTNSSTITGAGLLTNAGHASSGGSDTPHNTVQRTVLGTFYRKL